MLSPTDNVGKKIKAFFYSQISLSLLIAIFFSILPTRSTACYIEQLLAERANIISSISQRSDSLLVFENGNLSSLITKKIVDRDRATTGNFQLNLIELASDEPILKQTVNIDKSSFDKILNDFSEVKRVHKIVLAPKTIFIFLNKDIDFAPTCSNKIHIFKKKNSSSYSFQDDTNLTMTKNQALALILKHPEALEDVSDEITITLASENLRSVTNELDKKTKKILPFLNSIKIKNSEFGAQMSEAIIPISTYQFASKIRDGNDLHYLTTFKASKTPIFIKETPKLSLGFEGGNLLTNLNLRLGFPISNRSNLNFGMKFNEQLLDLSSAFISHKQFLKNNNFLKVRLGKLSLQDFGILINNQNYSLINETVINLAGYSSLTFNCLSCVRSGLTTGFERYFLQWNSNFGGNYLIQNFSDRTENLTEIFLRKKFKSKNSILLKINHNITDNFATEFKLSYTIPLGAKNRSASGNTNVNFSYISQSSKRITDWLEQDSMLIFMNTPNHFRRNWKNYIDFD